jgi:thioredoxin reductase
MSKTWDAIVVGAGPAGASCAVWLRHLGLDPLLLESTDRMGGLAARNPFADIWTVTSPGQTGAEVAAQIALQVQASGVDTWLNTQVCAVTGEHPIFSVSVARDGQPEQRLQAKTLVIASGVRAKPLPGFEGQSFSGVIVGPGDEVMSTDFKSTRVALLGGGDNAFENYEFVKQRGASQACIYARTVRAQKQFVARVPDSDLVVGAPMVDPVKRTVNGQPYDWILVLYGWQANIGFLDGLALAIDERGFVQTDMATAQSSVQGIYAIGEVAQRMHPCVPTAMADGVVAAKAIEKQLTGV